MSKPLSPAAQAVLTAQAKQRCLFEWSNVNDPPCHPSDPEWNGCVQCIDRLGVAAVARELAEQVVPDEPNESPYFTNEAVRLNRMGIRCKIHALAAELEGPNG